MSENSSLSTAEHARIRSQVLAMRVGLLSESESASVRRHLQGCDTCRDFVQELAEAPGGSGQHIPVELLAAWPKSSQTLRGLERQMVVRHISRCEECRSRLDLLGYAPEVVPVDSTEFGAPQRGEAVHKSPHSRDWARWTLGGWAAAASIAALLLALQPRSYRTAEPEALQGPPAGRSTTGAPAEHPAAAVHILDLPSVAELTSAQRSPGHEPAVAITDSSGHVVCLSLPAQGLHLGEVAGVAMELLDSDGAKLWSQSQSAQWFSRPRRLSLELGTSAWRPGRYTLRLTIRPSPAALVDEPEVREFPFEIRIRGR